MRDADAGSEGVVPVGADGTLFGNGFKKTYAEFVVFAGGAVDCALAPASMVAAGVL